MPGVHDDRVGDDPAHKPKPDPEDLHTPGDREPGWTDPTTHKEEPTMSDSTSAATANDTPEAQAPARIRQLHSMGVER